MQEKLKDKFANVLVLLTLFVIVIGGAAIALPHYRQAESLKAVNDELQGEIDAKKREIAELRENQRRFKTDTDFVERIARQNHKVFPGELVFIFEKE